jgi:hypothetical protein
MDRTVALAELEQAFRSRVRPAARLAVLAAGVLALVLAGVLGRFGTAPMRIAAVSVIGTVVLVAVAAALRERRARRRRDLVVKRLVLGADRTLGERVLRAFSLEDRAQADPQVGSLELAKLHADRAVDRIPRALVVARGERLAARLRMAAVVVGLLGAAGGASDPSRVLEGLDVLAARRGIAPIPIVFLEGVSVLVQSPSYLRLADRYADPTFSQAPSGSTLVVRGVPVRPGRTLVLAAEGREVPFVSEGGDGLVARWNVAASTDIWVAARFGDVLIREPQPIRVDAVPDGAPVVTLDGAPREVELEGLERLELSYSAKDDHGLRQIDLVLRSGGREERRVLEKLDGQSRVERGAQALDTGDPFLQRMFLPILVTIEAKDNDVLAGAKWGQSAAITIQPPPLGAPEATRYKALAAARGSVVDFLAWTVGEGAKTDADTRRASAERRAQASAALRDAATGRSGARVPSGLSAFLIGQARRLDVPPATAGAGAHVEDVLLAVDSAVRQLGRRDAQSVAKRMGDVAEDAANAFADARVSERTQRATERAQAALRVLEVGRANLAELDVLGADLGSVTRGELSRIGRALASRSLYHAELVARHLAARLHRPEPSFSAASGSQGGGVEGGRQSGEGDPQAPPSEASERFDELMGELSELTREHGALVEQVERNLRDASQAAETEELRREAAEKAQALREALEDLPRSGPREGSGRASAALAREHGAAMAERLDRLELDEALNSGKTARGLTDDARRKAREPESLSDVTDPESLDKADAALSDALSWAERALERMRRSAEAHARERLGEAAERERSIERRLGEMAGRAETGEARLPEPMLDRLRRAREAMKSAASELGEGRGEPALEHQREAQRMLEQGGSKPTTHNDTGPAEDRTPTGEGNNGRAMGTRAAVPAAEDRRRAQDFRRRVLEGLGKERGARLEPAIRRYAEGLLQ